MKSQDNNGVDLILGDSQDEKTKIITEITMLHQQLQFQFKEYKTILQLTVGFFKNIQEVSAK